MKSKEMGLFARRFTFQLSDQGQLQFGVTDKLFALVARPRFDIMVSGERVLHMLAWNLCYLRYSHQ